GAFATRKHVAHLVDAHRQTSLIAPALEKMASLAVLVRQCLAVVSACNARADLRHLHQGIPQTVGIDSQIFARCCHRLQSSHSIWPAEAGGSRRRLPWKDGRSVDRL